LREYEAGKYQDALKDYRQLLEKKKDDPRLYFNAGAAAYQNRQLDEAAKQFNEALLSPDLQMQQRAYYNLGNTYYRLGQQGAAEASQGTTPPGAPPEAKMKAWEQAVKNYESALKLNPQDEDAKFNHSFVQQQLEELKKQQQQQQSKDKDKDKSGGQKNQDQKNQDQKDEQKDQDKQQQSQSKQDSSQQKDSQAKNQKQDDQKSDQNQPDKQDDKQSQAQAKKDKAEKQDQKAQSQSGQPKEQSKEEAEREAAMMAAGQMTPQQAQQLMDAQKGDEEVLRLAPPDKQTRQNRSFKNW
jgi:Ca-activated chloride channel family protein